MIKGGKKEAKLNYKSFIIFFILIFFFVYLISGQIPTLHSIQGYVFHKDGEQVQAGIKVRINATLSGSFITTQTSGPPGNTGFYGTNINASDGELIIVTAFNATAIGGANSVNCNATINIANENIINLTSNNKTKSIGNITLGNTNNSFFEVKAFSEGTTTLNITSSCSSDGEKFDNLFIESITLRVAQQPPQLHAVQGYVFNIDNVTQAPSGTNVTINATETGSFITT